MEPGPNCEGLGIWGFPKKRGYHFVPITRTIVFWGLNGVPPFWETTILRDVMGFALSNPGQGAFICMSGIRLRIRCFSWMIGEVVVAVGMFPSESRIEPATVSPRKTVTPGFVG